MQLTWTMHNRPTRTSLNAASVQLEKFATLAHCQRQLLLPLKLQLFIPKKKHIYGPILLEDK